MKTRNTPEKSESYQVERYTMFTDYKTKYCKIVNSPHSDLQNSL